MRHREKESFIHKAIINVDSNIGSVYGLTLDDITCQDRSGNAVVIDKSKVNAEIDRLYEEYDALRYQREREYPTISDQLDMQYHDQLDGTTTWKDAIAKVKSDNPKP